MIAVTVLIAPLLALVSAVVYGLILCVPTMIALHYLHGFVPVVPPLGWQASFWLLATLSLLIPSGSKVDD